MAIYSDFLKKCTAKEMPGGTSMTDVEKEMTDLLEENRRLKEKLSESEERIRFLEDEEMTAFIIGDAG